jgi:phosphoenolpyruvate carboxylase
VLSKLSRIAALLYEREVQDLLPSEMAEMEERLLAEVTTLWLTERSRTRKPEVTDEVRTGLHFFDTVIWDVAPQVYEAMADALARYYPRLEPPPRFLTFGSWIGGDRDGNPNVTTQVTAETLRLHRGLAVERHRAVAQQLARALSISDRLAPPSAELSHSLEEHQSSPHVQYLAERYPDEPYRLRAAMLADDLAETSAGDMVARLHGDRDVPDPPLRSGQELIEPLELMESSLKQSGATAAAAAGLGPFRVQARVFGLHSARLDLRQYSEVHDAVLAELFRQLGYHDDYEALNPEERTELLSGLLEAPAPNLDHLGDLSDQSREQLELLRMLNRAVSYYGPDIIGPYIISMTRSAADMLAVLLLARWTGLNSREDSETEGLRIAPLFETRADLAAATETMRAPTRPMSSICGGWSAGR